MSTYRCRHCGAVLADDQLTADHEQRCALAHTCEHCGALRGQRCREPSGRPPSTEPANGSPSRSDLSGNDTDPWPEDTIGADENEPDDDEYPF